MRLRYIYAAIVLLLAGASAWHATHRRPEPPITPRPPLVTPAAIKLPTRARPPGPVEATPDEIARLTSKDRVTRIEAADTLKTRKPTPALIEAVEKARKDHPNDAAMMERLTCAKVRFPDPASLDFAYSLLPTDETAFAYRLPIEARCALNAVAERAGEDEVRARRVLLPAAMSPNFESSQAALRGLERTRLPDFPPILQAEVHSPDSFRREHAVRAALALHATDLIPGLVERALVDDMPGVRTIVRAHLLRSVSPNASRIVAYGIVHAPDDERMTDVFVKREAEFHDPTPPLLDIAEDVQAPMTQRLEAVQVVAKYGDTKIAIPRFRALRDKVSGRFREMIEEGIVSMEMRYGPPPLPR